MSIDVYIRDNATDTGSVPSPDPLSISPDIIVRPTMSGGVVGEFGEGSGNEDSTTLGSQVESGQDNFIYVRLKNRGDTDAIDTSVTVYWSPVASLVTPSLWTEIGTLTVPIVPAGDTIVVSDPPLSWPQAGIPLFSTDPTMNHYCFIGIVNHASDPAPVYGAFMNFSDFMDLIRNNNNVAWRNFNVVDLVPIEPPTKPVPGDPTAGYAPLRFLIVGAPDRDRPMDVEVQARLPQGARVILETPWSFPPLLGAAKLKLPVKPHEKRGTALIMLPQRQTIRFGNARLGQNDRYPCALWVRAPRARAGQQFQVVVRQIYKGDEVGRVTWLLRVVRRQTIRRAGRATRRT